MFGVVINLCAVEQRFGGDATLIESDTAQFAFFEQFDVQPFCSGTFCSHIATRTTADNCQIYHLF